MNAAVYIMASQKNGTLYTGVTGSLLRRAYEHRENLLPGFTRVHRCKLLVWFEQHLQMRAAIQREKTIKHWVRKWKLDLIEATNPMWADLYPFISGEGLDPRIKSEDDSIKVANQ
ncbi:MAG: GIY-YIG nuclease family protein [Hyphomicrobiales bacterium]